MDKELRYREYMGWACVGNQSLQTQLDMALAAFRKRYGRPPAVVAVHRKDGVIPPQGVPLVEAPRLVRQGDLHLYL